MTSPAVAFAGSSGDAPTREHFRIDRRVPSAELRIVVFPRRVVIENGHELRHTVRDALVEGARRFVFDCFECMYLSSPALGILMSVGREITRAGGVLVLASVGEDVAELLKHTGIDTLFTLSPSLSNALEMVDAMPLPEPSPIVVTGARG